MKSKCVSYVRRDSPRSLPIVARFKSLWTTGWEGLWLETRSCGWSVRNTHRLQVATGRHPKEEAPPYKTRCGLALNGTVTEEIYEVGFNASTRFVRSRPIFSL